MQPDQGESAQVVIEAHLLAPAPFVVALLAGFSESGGVWIINPMAGHTTLLRLLILDGGGMTAVAGHIDMLAKQRVPGARQVVVGGVLPALVVVAVSAIRAEPPGMPVVGGMATVTVLRRLVLEVRLAMAVLAQQTRMHALQCKLRFAPVIEPALLLALEGMAAFALRSAAAAVYVIR